MLGNRTQPRGRAARMLAHRARLANSVRTCGPQHDAEPAGVRVGSALAPYSLDPRLDSPLGGGNARPLYLDPTRSPAREAPDPHRAHRTPGPDSSASGAIWTPVDGRS